MANAVRRRRRLGIIEERARSPVWRSHHQVEQDPESPERLDPGRKYHQVVELALAAATTPTPPATTEANPPALVRNWNDPARLTGWAGCARLLTTGDRWLGMRRCRRSRTRQNAPGQVVRHGRSAQVRCCGVCRRFQSACDAGELPVRTRGIRWQAGGGRRRARLHSGPAASARQALSLRAACLRSEGAAHSSESHPGRLPDSESGSAPASWLGFGCGPVSAIDRRGVGLGVGRHRTAAAAGGNIRGGGAR